MRRTSFTRYRRGKSTSTTISPAFLELFSAAVGITNVSLNRVLPRGLRGQIDVNPQADVNPGDILVEAVTSRIFVVLQIDLRPAIQRLSVAELWPPIGDEFDSGRIDLFWTQSIASAFTFELATSSLTLTESFANDGDWQDGPFLYQTLSGDFDVYASVKISASAPGGQENFGGIAAREIGGNRFAAVGLYSASTTLQYVHVQCDDGVTIGDVSIGNALADNYVFVRLIRTGSQFSAFYSLTSLPPIREADWHSLGDTGENWLTTDSVYIGILAFIVQAGMSPPPATDLNFHVDYFRNWFPATR